MKLMKVEVNFNSISHYEKIILDTFAELYVRRITSQITQQELADRIGITLDELSTLENLEVLPSLTFLNKYAMRLGLSLEIKISSSK